VIRLLLVALAAAGAVWLSDDLARIWDSDAVARGRVGLERWLRDSRGASGTAEAEVWVDRAEIPRASAPREPALEPVEAPPEFTPAEPAPPAFDQPDPEPPLSAGGADGPLEPAVGDPPEGVPAERLSRMQAAEVRSRLGRVMTLAGGERR
jgi:hypothetical protein